MATNAFGDPVMEATNVFGDPVADTPKTNAFGDPVASEVQNMNPTPERDLLRESLGEWEKVILKNADPRFQLEEVPSVSRQVLGEMFDPWPARLRWPLEQIGLALRTAANTPAFLKNQFTGAPPGTYGYADPSWPDDLWFNQSPAAIGNDIAIPALPEQFDPTAKVIVGGLEPVRQLVNNMISRREALTLPIGAGGKTGATLFGAPMAAALPEVGQQSWQTFQRPDATLEEKAGAVTSVPLNVLMTGLIGSQLRAKPELPTNAKPHQQPVTQREINAAEQGDFLESQSARMEQDIAQRWEEGVKGKKETDAITVAMESLAKVQEQLAQARAREVGFAKGEQGGTINEYDLKNAIVGGKPLADIRAETPLEFESRKAFERLNKVITPVNQVAGEKDVIAGSGGLRETAPEGLQGQISFGKEITGKQVPHARQQAQEPLASPIRQGEWIQTTAERLLETPDKLRYAPNRQGDYDGGQLVSRLLNTVPPGEKAMLESLGMREAFKPGRKVKAEEVKQWIREFGPRVEVKKLFAEEELLKGNEHETALVEERSRLTHEIESAITGTGITFNVHTGLRLNHRLAEEFGLKSVYDSFYEKILAEETVAMKVLGEDKFFELQKKIERANEVQQELDDLAEGFDKNYNTDSATLNYTQVNPKELTKMPGAVDILVKLPIRGKVQLRDITVSDLPNNATPEQVAELRQRSLSGERVAYRHDMPLTKYQSSHYPQEGDNLLAHVRGYMESLPNGKRVFRVFELQSDWAQELRRQKERMKKEEKPEYSLKELTLLDDPLVRQYEELAVKAAVEHARKEGADYVAFDDAETAMMTEGHDRGAVTTPVAGEYNVKLDNGNTVKVRIDENSDTTMFIPETNKWVSIRGFGWDQEVTLWDQIRKQVPFTHKIMQEGGMRFHYDKTIPSIAEAITGQKGERVEFGEHKNTLDPEWVGEGEVRNEATGQVRPARLVQKPRNNLFFKNPDGTPKITSSARMYSLEKTQPDKPFTFFGKDRAGALFSPLRTSGVGKESRSPVWRLEELYGDKLMEFDKWVKSTLDRQAIEDTLAEFEKTAVPGDWRAQTAMAQMQVRLNEWGKEKKSLEVKGQMTTSDIPPKDLKKRLEWRLTHLPDESLRPESKLEGYMGSAHTVLADMVKKGGHMSDMARELLRVIDDQSMRVPIRMVSDAEAQGNGGLYYSTEDVIKVNKTVSKDFQIETIVHEIVHAATVRKLDRELSLSSGQFRNLEKHTLDRYLLTGKDENVKQLIKLYRKAMADPVLQKEYAANPQGFLGYGISNIKEFMSETWSNPAFARRLNDIAYLSSKRTLLDKIVEAVRNFIGLDPKVDSLLKHALMTTAEIMAKDRQATPWLDTKLEGPTVEELYSPKRESVTETVTKFPLDNPIVNAYAQPMMTKLREHGSALADRVSSEFMQIAQDTKKIISQNVDTFHTAMQEMGKASQSWWRETTKVTDKTAVNNFFRVNEDRILVPEKNRKAGELAFKHNLAIGRMAREANPGFKESGKLQRILSSFGYEIVRRGEGPAYEAWAEGVAKRNGKPVAEVKTFFRRWKAELDKPGNDAASMDAINQDFARRFPKTVTHVWSNGAWHEVVAANPFNYLRAATEMTASAVAFRRVYPLVQQADGKWTQSGLLQDTRKQIMAQMRTDKGFGKMFDDTITVMQGHPLDAYTKGWNAPDSLPGFGYRMAGEVVGRPIKTAMLTGQAGVNIPESIVGAPMIFMGPKRLAKAMQGKWSYRDAERAGQVNAVFWDMAFDPTSPVRSASRIGSNMLSKLTLQHMLNEFQGFQSSAVTKVLVDEIKGGKLSEVEKQDVIAIARAADFSTAEAKAIASGKDAALLERFMLRMPSFLVGENIRRAEMSRAGNSRLFNSLFWFQSYGQTVMNQFRKVGTNLADDVSTKNWPQAKRNALLMAKMIGGRTMQGALTKALLAAVTYGIAGLRQEKKDAQEEIGTFLRDSAVMGIGGLPAMLARATSNTTDAESAVTGAIKLSPAATSAMNLGDMVAGTGAYQGLDATDRIGKFLTTVSPGGKFLKTGLALAGLKEYDMNYAAAKRAFYEWAKDQPEWRTGKMGTSSEEDAAFRQQMIRVEKALADGKDWMSELAGADTKKAADSLERRTVLDIAGKALGQEQLTALEQRIGQPAVQRLQSHDAMLRQIARTLRENKPQVPDLKGFETDATTERQRQERVQAKLDAPAQEWLKRWGLKLPSYEPKDKIGNKDVLYSTDEAKAFEEELQQQYQRFVNVLMQQDFAQMTPEKRKERFSEKMEQAKRIARARVKSKLTIKE